MDMIDLHKRYAETKSISFDVGDLGDLPKIFGSEMEISRLFHNILNNAIKYSYHSVSAAQRTIRIRPKIPYDPGFRRRRFSIIFENYGLGISKSEGVSVFKPGVRGEQAIAEVPNGSGIGLSEALKIMQLHNGEIKIRSVKLHESSAGQHTYLTEVELIFPYKNASAK
jgi:two-component system sensor histidine kinase EvgS